MRATRCIAIGVFLTALCVAQIASADTFPKYELEGRWFQIDIAVKGIAGPPAFQELPFVKTQFKATCYLYFDFDSIGGEHYDLIRVWEDSPGSWTSDTLSDYIKPIYQYGEFGEGFQLPGPATSYNFYDPDGNDVDLFFTGMIVLKPDKKMFGQTKGATVYMYAVTNDGVTPDGEIRTGTVKIKGKQVVGQGGDTSKLPFNQNLFLP